ncbi:MAG TPA: beta-N-acetylhexosaminidase [Flavisolibacter sp.]|nr:beta-N-acetylhexosaminidase [Flavisolibacter sp.]
MNRILFVAIICLCTFISWGQPANIAVIPEPVQMTKKTGVFLLPAQVTIGVRGSQGIQPVVSALKQKLKVTGSTVVLSEKTTSPTIHLSLNSKKDAVIGKEGYKLSVTPKAITINANEAAGLFYGLQTLFQLFPKEIESTSPVKNIKWTVPCVEITDYPRFEWRGLMFDVVRHFFTKAEVKHYIDDMVRYKFNMLHLHLADDEGWRMEIKSLPLLTKVGAWRVNKVGYFGTFSPPSPDEPKDYGGFYTQDDLKEIIQYAKERFVNILPEIDVPGHSLAAIASYPELSCTPEANTYRVRSGEPIMDWSRGAPPIALVDNTLCPANEKVYEFLDKVITEVAQVFPFEYIHMGGDEAPHNFWEKNDQIKELMKRERLTTIEQVQNYFTKRVDSIVRSKGKKFIGWDEILEGGGLPSTAAVMSWRGMKGGIEAAKSGHEVVMSPSDYAYIDYMQGDVALEPRVYASLYLNKTYQFEPLPNGVDPKFIKGGQANLWTEQVYNMRHAEYMTFPRALAIAESVWSPKEKKEWKRFFNKVETHFKRLDEAEIKYATSVYEPKFSLSRDKEGQLQIEMQTEVDVSVHYTFDNSFPDYFYPVYKKAITPPKDAVMLRAVSYRGKEQMGRMISVPIADLEKRAPKK